MHVPFKMGHVFISTGEQRFFRRMWSIGRRTWIEYGLPGVGGQLGRLVRAAVYTQVRPQTFFYLYLFSFLLS